MPQACFLQSNISSYCNGLLDEVQRMEACNKWVKERRPSVDLAQGVPSLSSGFPKANDPVPVTVFNGVGTPSNFTRPLEFLHKNSSLGLLIPRTVYQKAPLLKSSSRSE
ncbi:hypothetical protein Peur_011775 [Populus x canadensis]